LAGLQLAAAVLLSPSLIFKPEALNLNAFQWARKPPKLPFLCGISTPSNTWSLGPRSPCKSAPYRHLIASAVFASRAIASHLLVGVLTTLLGGAERNSFSQCAIVRSVLHGNPVLELPCPHFQSCNHMLGALCPALGKLAGCNCGTL